MRILLITRQFPYPERDGESIAIQTMSRALVSEGVEVHLLAINTSKHRYDGPRDIEPLAHYASITSVAVDNRIKPLNLFRSLWSEEPYYVSRYRSEEMIIALKELLKRYEFDVVQCEGLQTMLYAPTVRHLSPVKIVYRPHNVESTVWNRLKEESSSWLRRAYYKREVPKLEKFECGVGELADHIVAMTDIDKTWFSKYHDRVSVVPIAIEPIQNVAKQCGKKSKSIGFLGSLDWPPNQYGLKWYIDTVHKEVKRNNPDYKLIVAGRNPDAMTWLSDVDGVELWGEIKDVTKFWEEVDMLVVPLKSGSGMRVKIIEAMQHETIVLTTVVGIEGVAAGHSQHAFISDDPTIWIEIIQSFLAQYSRRYDHIVSNAKHLVTDAYNPKKCAQKLIALYS